MIFIETSVFTKQVTNFLSPEEYRKFQLALLTRPEQGAIIPGSGGLRKTRWAVKGKGKRGGVRVIYYWAVSNDKILLLFMYAKNEQEDLTPQQLKVLRSIIEEEYP